MKVKIEKEIELSGKHFFLVSAEGKHVSAFHYDPSAPDDKFNSEKKKLDAAMRLAKQIEQGDTGIIETIYETP